MTRVAPVLVLLSAFGCAGFESRPPPGPWPIPEPWDPAQALRGRLPRGDSGAVVLDTRDGLSPDEAAIMAVDRNPRLRVAQAERGIGQAQLLAAGVLPNPTLDLSLGLPVSGGEAMVLGYGAGISWDVTALFSRGARVSAAEENLASIDLEIAWQEWQIAQAARLHAIRCIYLARRAEVAGGIVQARSRRLDALVRARAEGAVTQREVDLARRSHADALLAGLELEQQLAAERAALNRAIGADPAGEIALDLSFRPDDGLTGRQPLLDDLPRRRLDLLALQHAHRSHDEAARAAVIAQFPPVEIGFDAVREVDDVASAGSTLSFEIPFFGRNQGALALERARQVRVEAEYDWRLLEAQTDVVRASGELAAVRNQLAAAREESEAAARLAEQARAAAASGALGALQATEELERSLSSRQRTLRAEQSLAELQVALSLASGTHVRGSRE